MKKKGKTMNNHEETVLNENAVNESEKAQTEETVQNAETNENVEVPTQEEWAEALKKCVEERDAYKDMALRSQAEFANFKRRNATVRTDAYDDGVRETIFAILPIIDNLELAIKHAEQQSDSGAMVEGVKMTLRLLMDAMGKLGLEEVESEGVMFDPEKHNAIMREPGGEADMIAEVFQKGYKVKDKIIRYAMVKVFSGEE